jgi:YVTN family beta-propeller protein
MKLFTLLALALSAAAQPTLLVLNKEGNVAIVDPASRKVLGRVGVGEMPHELAASSDGKLAFASNYGTPQRPGHTISVIDIAARKELHRVDLSPLVAPHGLNFAGGKLYFTAEANKVIGRYDPETNRVDWILGTGQNKTHMVLVTPDLAHIYTSNIESNTISAFDRARGDWNETVVPVGRGPEGFDMSPDGRQIWAAGSQDGGVAIIDVASKKVIEAFRVGTQRSNRLKFTPDGKLVLISDLAGGDLYILDRATHKQVKRIHLGRQPAGILIPPGGARAYVAVTGDNYVAILDLATLEVNGRIEPGAGPDGMAWVQ